MPNIVNKEWFPRPFTWKPLLIILMVASSLLIEGLLLVKILLAIITLWLVFRWRRALRGNKVEDRIEKMTGFV